MMLSRSHKRFAPFLIALLTCASQAHGREIGGTIAATLTIAEDSILTGDVTCTISGAPCILLLAPGITLDLNGFSITGPADAQTGCAGQTSATEHGIEIGAQNGVAVRGPGLVQQFRGSGIRVQSSNGAKVTGVTVSTNCASGIHVVAGSGHEIENNVAVRNGSLTNPCGGI
jgi:parallel beta-helix repeat protein